MKKFLPYDKRVRIDEVTSKKVRDIMLWCGEKTEGEVVRQSVDSRWQHLKEEQDDLKKVKTQ